MNYLRPLIFGICLQFSTLAQRMERAEAFIIQAMPNYYKVVSPAKKRGGRVAVILQNKTLNSIKGKFIDENEKNLKFITVKSDGEKTVEFNFDTDKKFYFVPLDPAFQKIILNIGKSAYEIPAQE